MVDTDVSDLVARCSFLHQADVSSASLEALDGARGARAQCGNDCRYSEPPANNDNAISRSDCLDQSRYERSLISRLVRDLFRNPRCRNEVIAQLSIMANRD